MIDIRGDYKVVLVPNKRQQIFVNGLWRVDIAVEVDVPRPPGPARLLVREGPEAARIDVRDGEALDEVEKVLFKTLSAVGEARRG